MNSINGLTGSTTVGHSDWFYYVNGVEASVGAAAFTLSKGDVVQWDYRRWDATMHIPAIVGAYPEPFLSGTGGKRLPVRVECSKPNGAACKTVEQRLSDAGALNSEGVLGSSAGSKVLRVIVAPWPAIRDFTGAVATLKGPPSASGVFARFSQQGDTLHARGRAGQGGPSGTARQWAGGRHRAGGQRPGVADHGPDRCRRGRRRAGARRQDAAQRVRAGCHPERSGAPAAGERGAG